jgi:hypothetical protein
VATPWLAADRLRVPRLRLWGGLGHWEHHTPPQLIAAYEDALSLLDTCDIEIAHASIDKAGLHAKYDGAADDNAYVLGLQFLWEKINRYGLGNKIVVADEHGQHQLRASKMMQDMQQWAGQGEVPGQQLTTIIDCLHFVPSHASPGVQMADLIAFIMQRQAQGENHPDAQAAMIRLSTKVSQRIRTYRMTWPEPRPGT